MAKGPLIPDNIDVEISRLWKQGVKKGPKMLKALQESYKRDEAFKMPSLSYVQKVMKRISDAVEAKEKIGEYPDRLWSLGATANESWSSNPGVNKFLLETGAWYTVVRRPFTVRQARWVALLRDTVVNYLLLAAAEAYAAREWACEVLGQTFDTSDLDARIMFLSPVQYEAAVSVGAIPELYTIHDDIGNLEKKYRRIPGLFPMFTPDAWIEDRLFQDDLYKLSPKDKETRDTVRTYLARLENIRTEILKPDEQVVYALWLGKIGDTSIWPTLSLDRRLQIFEQLRKSVRQGILKREDRVMETPLAGPWKPTEILKKFGLD